MRVFVILSSLLFGCVRSNPTSVTTISAFYPFKDATITNQFQGRIINGEQAEDGQFPWQVYVIATNDGTTTQFTCGGSIISPEWILTAAHCVSRSLNFKIGYGTKNIFRANITRASHRIYVHPGFNPRNLNNDIALIQVTPAVGLSKKIKTVELPKLNQVPEKFIDAIAVTSGWGRNANLSSPVGLQYTNVKVLRNSVCAIRYRSIVIESTICVIGAASKLHNICNGDSGGPLVTQKNGSFIQIGVASFVSSAGCTYGYPSGFARVTSFRKWINDVAGI